MPTKEQIIAGLRCIADTRQKMQPNCTECPYEEFVKMTNKDAIRRYGTDVWHTCKVEKILNDAADLLEGRGEQ